MPDPITPEERTRWRSLAAGTGKYDTYALEVFHAAVPRLLDRVEELEAAVEHISETARLAVMHGKKLESEIMDCSGSCRLPEYD